MQFYINKGLLKKLQGKKHKIIRQTFQISRVKLLNQKIRKEKLYRLLLIKTNIKYKTKAI